MVLRFRRAWVCDVEMIFKRKGLLFMKNGRSSSRDQIDISRRLYVAAFFIFIIYMFVDFVDYFHPIYRLVCLLSLCGVLYSAGCIQYKREKIAPQKIMVPLFWIMFALYVHLLAVFTVLDPLLGRGYGAVYHNIENITRSVYDANYLNLTPFDSIINVYFANILRFGANSLDYALNFIGNVFAYMPMSFFLPMLFEKAKKWWVYTLSLLVTVAAVEAIQYVQMAGSCDVDDIILSVGGAVAVFFVTKIPKIKQLLNRFSFGLFSHEPYTDCDEKADSGENKSAVCGEK